MPSPRLSCLAVFALTLVIAASAPAMTIRFEATNAFVLAVDSHNVTTTHGAAAMNFELVTSSSNVVVTLPNTTLVFPAFEFIHGTVAPALGPGANFASDCFACDAQFLSSPPFFNYQSGGEFNDPNSVVDSGSFGLSPGTAFTPTQFFWRQTVIPPTSDPNDPPAAFFPPGQPIPIDANDPAVPIDQLLGQMLDTRDPDVPSFGFLQLMLTPATGDPNSPTFLVASEDVVRILISGPISGINVIPLPAALPLLGAALVGLGYLFRKR